MVRRRDLRPGKWQMVLLVSCYRPQWQPGGLDALGAPRYGLCRVPSYTVGVRWYLGGGEDEGTLSSINQIDCVPEIAPPPPRDNG